MSDRPEVVKAWSTEFELSLPDEAELERIVKSTLRERNAESPVLVNLSRRDLEVVVRNLKGLSRRQARQIILESVSEDNRFDVTDVNRILAQKRRTLQGTGLLEYVESPVDLAEIGGLSRLKLWLGQRQAGFSKEAAEFGLGAPKGVLMLGVQGAGKSLAAKAVATAWQMPLMRMDVGASTTSTSANPSGGCATRLHQAERWRRLSCGSTRSKRRSRRRPAAAPTAALSQRMFGTLLTWMQEHKGHVFTIATANDIEACRPSCCARAASTRSSSSTCRRSDARVPDPLDPPEETPPRSERSSTWPRWRRRRTATAARRSSRGSWRRCTRHSRPRRS
jgi:SpoVK/Ycf46/Vps4 family AAA+-type ATPase